MEIPYSLSRITSLGPLGLANVHAPRAFDAALRLLDRIMDVIADRLGRERDQNKLDEAALTIARFRLAVRILDAANAIEKRTGSQEVETVMVELADSPRHGNCWCDVVVDGRWRIEWQEGLTTPFQADPDADLDNDWPDRPVAMSVQAAYDWLDDPDTV